MNSNSSKVFYGIAIIIIIGIFATATLNNQSSDTQTTGAQTVTAQSKSTLQTNRNDFNFGDINIYGGKVSTNFNLSNKGAEPITLTDISSSCMCTTATIDNQTFSMPMGGGMNPKANITIAPGSQKTLTVTFDPLAHGDNGTGPITRVISIETNSLETPSLELKVSGNVVKP